MYAELSCSDPSWIHYDMMFPSQPSRYVCVEGWGGLGVSEALNRMIIKALIWGYKNQISITVMIDK